MRKIIVALCLMIVLFSCRKYGESCYECQMSPANSDYTNVGCFTEEEWDNYEVIDPLGNYVDKDNKCRKR